MNGSMSMAMCVKAILAYDRRMQNEYEYRLSRIGRFVNRNYDEEMTNVLRFTTHYVARQIGEQYAGALEKCASYKLSDDRDVGGYFLISERVSEHRLRISYWKCECEFSISMRLPRLYAVSYHKHISLSGPLIPWSCIDERWPTPNRPLKQAKQLAYDKFSTTGPGSVQKKMMTQSERYKEAIRATHLIAR